VAAPEKERLRLQVDGDCLPIHAAPGRLCGSTHISAN
jgi:hypothetical protein